MLLLKDMVELEMSGLGHTASCREGWPHPSGFSWEPRADRSFFQSKEKPGVETEPARAPEQENHMDENAAQGFRCWGRSRAGSEPVTSLE